MQGSNNMQVKLITIVICISLIIAAVWGVYRQGHDNGFQLAMFQMQSRATELTRKIVDETNKDIAKDKVIVEQYLNKQYQFDKEVAQYDFTFTHQESGSCQCNNIDDNELLELQHIINTANKY